MAWVLDDTIAAIASAPGPAARGIIRVSGPRAVELAGDGFRADGDQLLPRTGPPRGLPGRWQLAEIGRGVPGWLLLWPGERSYTREPVVEIHLPGSPPILAATLADICRRGARLAEPGEFTLRAFLHGRLDLTQAEAVLGVIDASGESELRAALRQLAGGLARPLDALRHKLLDLLAHLEAGLDFVEEDIEFISAETLRGALAEIAEEIEALVAQAIGRSAGAPLPRVVLRGRPNAGKSSLFNAFVGEPAALVAEVAGTTRDYLTAEIRSGGIPFLLIDTAGIEGWPASDGPAAEAQSLAAEQAAEAVLEVLCLDGSRPPDAWEQEEMRRTPQRPRIVVATKLDLALDAALPADVIGASSRTGQGLAALQERIRQELTSLGHHESGLISATAIRCRASLAAAAAAMRRALGAADSGEELVAAELRAALEELALVVGAVYTDDVLDRIFGRFCIGK